jgi:hypothetical protein
VSDEFILKIKASVIAADVNAHSQFNHATIGETRSPPRESVVGFPFPQWLRD